MTTNQMIDELKELAGRLERYGVQASCQNLLAAAGDYAAPLIRLRTGELVTERELARRAEDQRKVAAKQTLRGVHPMVLEVDETSALDPEW